MVKARPTREAATPVFQSLPPETTGWSCRTDYDLAELSSTPSQKTASAPSSKLRLLKCLLFTTLKGFVSPKGHEQNNTRRNILKVHGFVIKWQITPTVTPWELTKSIISNLTDLLVVMQKKSTNFLMYKASAHRAGTN